MTHSCPGCGKEVTNRQRKYCSQECRQSQTKKLEGVCEQCRKPFWRYASQLHYQTVRGDTRAGRFCSRACYHKTPRASESVTPIRPRDRILLGFLSYGPCTCAELAARLGISRNSVSVTNQINVHTGLVERKKSPEKANRLVFAVTDDGKERLASLGLLRDS